MHFVITLYKVLQSPIGLNFVGVEASTILCMRAMKELLISWDGANFEVVLNKTNEILRQGIQKNLIEKSMETIRFGGFERMKVKDSFPNIRFRGNKARRIRRGGRQRMVGGARGEKISEILTKDRFQIVKVIKEMIYRILNNFNSIGFPLDSNIFMGKIGGYVTLDQPIYSGSKFPKLFFLIKNTI